LGAVPLDYFCWFIPSCYPTSSLTALPTSQFALGCPPFSTWRHKPFAFTLPARIVSPFPQGLTKNPRRKNYLIFLREKATKYIWHILIIPQGRTHQIKQMLSKEQKAFLKDWLEKTNSSAWEDAGDHFQDIFETD